MSLPGWKAFQPSDHQPCSGQPWSYQLLIREMVKINRGQEPVCSNDEKGPGVDRNGTGVKNMFTKIAADYDFFNHLLSLHIDRLWRRKARNVLSKTISPTDHILDLCTGTGDMALELQRLGNVIGCDFCRPMLDLAAGKVTKKGLGHRVSLVEGDGMRLPFPSGRFGAVTLAFGFRNMEDYDQALEELYRVIKDSGVLMILDFSIPENRLFRKLYLFYINRILPRIGNLMSGVIGPYQYLPASVQAFPDRKQVESRLGRAGFASLDSRSLTTGIVTIYLAIKKG